MEALDIRMSLQLLPATFKNNFFERICFLFYNSSQGLCYDNDFLFPCWCPLPFLSFCSPSAQVVITIINLLF